VVYVLHCFQKKSKRGIATSKADLDLVKQRLTIAAEDYRKRTKEEQ
jgi:phage-related protein